MTTARPTTPTTRPRRRRANGTPSKLDLVRGFGTMLGPSALLDLLVGTSIVLVGRGWFARRPATRLEQLLRPLVALGAIAPAIYLSLVRPRMLHWGATDEETRRPLPGDDLIPHPAFQSTRAATIDAPVEAVWPWLAQIGQDRGGFYSYEWIENLAGCEMHNADRIHPEWQTRAVGELIPLHWAGGLACTVFESNRAIGLQGWGTFVLEPIDARRTRLLARNRCPSGWRQWYSLLLLEIPHFIMERRMLLGIKARAEQAAQGNALVDAVLPDYEFRGAVSTRIHASREQIFRALHEVTLADMPLAHTLGEIRYLPGKLAGRLPKQPTEATRPFLELVDAIVLAEDPGREIVLGGIGKLHNLVDQQFVPLDDAAAFERFDEPGYEKLVESIRIAGGDAASGYTVVGEHRTRAIGRDARWKFALYWYLLVGWAGNIAFKLLLDAVKRRAEPLAATRAEHAPRGAA